MVVWSVELCSRTVQRACPPHLQKGICMDTGATYVHDQLREDQEALKEGEPKLTIVKRECDQV